MLYEVITDQKLRSPLTEVGVNAKVGDYIVAVNGISAKTTNDLYSMLVGLADKEVELSLNSKASEEGARRVLVKPIADESELYYYNCVITSYSIHYTKLYEIVWCRVFKSPLVDKFTERIVETIGSKNVFAQHHQAVRRLVITERVPIFLLKNVG